MITPSVTAGQDFTFLALGRKRLCQLYFKRIALNIFFFSFLLKQCWIPGGLFLVAETSKLPWVGWWKPIIEGISKHLWCFSSNAWTFVSNAFKRNFHSMWKHQEIIDAREGQKFQRAGCLLIYLYPIMLGRKHAESLASSHCTMRRFEMEKWKQAQNQWNQIYTTLQIKLHLSI